MSVLSRIRSWLSSLFGGADDGASESASEADTAPTDSERAADATRVAGEATPDDEPAYRCSICGTPVEDPEEPCPLCRSSDVVPAEEVDAGGGDESEPTLDGTSVTRPGDDEEAVNRLRELRRRAAEEADDTPSAEEADDTPSAEEADDTPPVDEGDASRDGDA